MSKLAMPMLVANRVYMLGTNKSIHIWLHCTFLSLLLHVSLTNEWRKRSC